MWIQISSGQGPDECELAVKHFVNYLKKRALSEGVDLQWIDGVAGRLETNCKSALFSISSEEQEFIMPYIGAVLWRCQSPYRPKHKRKNWFIEVEVFAEPSFTDFDLKYVQYQSLKSSGPGGQHVNKTESAVRATYTILGISAVASEERSQRQNKKLALARLAKMIKESNQEKIQHSKHVLRNQHGSIQRGNPRVFFEGEEFKIKR